MDDRDREPKMDDRVVLERVRRNSDQGKRRALSFCLFGTKKIYTVGMVQNVKLAAELYPDWQVLIYVGCKVARSVVEELVAEGAEVRIYDEAEMPGHRALALRFFPVTEGWDCVIFRDADSRVNPREVAAVHEWLSAGTAFHVMHEHHDTSAVLGGMWGVRGTALKDLPLEADRYFNDDTANDNYGSDMLFLSRYLQPKLNKTNTTHHCASGRRLTKVYDANIIPRPFPPTTYRGFVGQPVNCPRLCNYTHFLHTGCPHVVAGTKLSPEVTTALRHQPNLLDAVLNFLPTPAAVVSDERRRP